MYPFCVIEDLKGNLSLAIFSYPELKLIYLNRSYAEKPGELEKDLCRLLASKSLKITPDAWEGNEADGTKCLTDYFPEEEQAYRVGVKGSGWRIIADEDGLYPEKMKEAGERELRNFDYQGKVRKECEHCWFRDPIWIKELMSSLCSGILSPEGCPLKWKEPGINQWENE